MKIMIINPNSDETMRGLIEQSAAQIAGRDVEVICRCVDTAPQFIDTYRDQMATAAGMARLVEENEETVDAFIVACHCDPNLDLMKEITDKVVVGIGEASMKLASMLGNSFSVVSTDLHSTPNKYALIRKYGLEACAASVRAPRPGDKQEALTEREKLICLSKLAVEEDMAEVIVLGCAGYSGLDKLIQKKIGVPVLDGVSCAVFLAEGMVRYGASTSKIRRYSGLR